jgi:hypothetical protein
MTTMTKRPGFVSRYLADIAGYMLLVGTSLLMYFLPLIAVWQIYQSWIA